VVVRYQERFQEMMAQAEVAPDAMRGLLDRLETFVHPFCASLGPTERRRAAEYRTGLLSHLDHKTAEGIAYLLDQDRQPMQRFIGQADWDHRPALAILAERVGERLGEPDGVIVFDPSAFAKKGDKSVGVARQWCGRLGKVENCQVGVYMGYVSRIEHALVDFRLFLPEEWTTHRARCRAAGIPREVRAQTRHELALEMLAESNSVLPHAWVAGDDEMGRPAWFRRALRGRGERYLLAVPANTLIRDQEAAPPEYSGRGRHPKNPFARVDVWSERLAEGSGTRIEVRDGEKGRWWSRR
jgi:SRSO17 transposase